MVTDVAQLVAGNKTKRRSRWFRRWRISPDCDLWMAAAETWTVYQDSV